MTLAAIRVRLEQLKIVYQDPISLRGRLLRGVAWSMAGVLTVQGLKLVVGIVLARILGNVGYGELGIINSTIVTLGIFSGLGLGITATKYVAQLRSEDASRAGQVIGFLVKTALVAGVTMTVGVILLAPLIAGRILGAQHLTRELQFSALLLLLNALNGVQLGTLTGLESFQTIARLNVLDGMLFVILAGVGAWVAGLIGVIAAYVLVALGKWAVSQWALRKACCVHGIEISYRRNDADWRLLWMFALPIVIASLAAQPFVWLSRVTLAKQPDGFAEVGVFFAAFVWTNILLFIPHQISTPAMPILSELHKQREFIKFDRLFRSSLFSSTGAATILAVVIGLASPLIMRSYGDAFASGWSTLVILLIAYVFSAGTIVLRDMLTAFGTIWWQAIFSGVWGVILAGSLFFLVEYGAIGLAFAYLAAFFAQFVLQFLFVRQRIAKERNSTF